MTEPFGRRRFLQTAALAGLGLAACRVFRSRSDSGPSVAERLGYPHDARLIITNADDIGCTHSVNDASIKAFAAGGINSGSVVVPCHGLAEFCQWSRTQPDVDLGIHLAFVSERPSLRWGPILPRDQVPSLVDPDGYFPHAWSRDRKVNVKEVEAECRAQIERGRELGINPTHLDAHQHFLQFYGPETFAVLVRVAGDYRLPYRVARSWFRQRPYLRPVPGHNIPLDHRIEMRPGLASPDRDSGTPRVRRPRAAAHDGRRPELGCELAAAGLRRDDESGGAPGLPSGGSRSGHLAAGRHAAHLLARPLDSVALAIR
jgi:YdjC-like protein